MRHRISRRAWSAIPALFHRRPGETACLRTGPDRRWPAAARRRGGRHSRRSRSCCHSRGYATALPAKRPRHGVRYGLASQRQGQVGTAPDAKGEFVHRNAAGFATRVQPPGQCPGVVQGSAWAGVRAEGLQCHTLAWKKCSCGLPLFRLSARFRREILVQNPAFTRRRGLFRHKFDAISAQCNSHSESN